MDSAVIPEVTIKNYLDYFLKIIKNDIDNSATDSIIEKVFQGIEPIGNYDPIREARKIFSKNEALKIKFGFNINAADLPAVHIVLPDENMEWESIGWSEQGFENEDDITAGTTGDVHFDTAYNLIILDKNADGVIFIYHVLRYMFLCSHKNLELSGFETLKISGRDLIQQPGMIPVDIYSRNLALSFKYIREFETLDQYRIGHSMQLKENQIVMKGDQKDIVVSDHLLD